MRILLVPTALMAAAALAACSSASAPQAPSSALQSPDAAVDLAGVCPKTVVVQTDWQPEAEHGAVYQLLGPGYTIDTDKKQVSGPLVINGKDTGVQIEIRTGGSTIGFQTIPAQMYIDKSITLGYVSTDAAIVAASDQPVKAVVSPLNKSPLSIMWDPASNPTWTGIADIGRSDAKVVVQKGVVFAPWLVQEGLIKSSQLDTGYEGTPARFVADPSIAQQAFATAEPYIYQHEIPAWGKPVKYQLLADVGYNLYPEALSVRDGDLAALSPCLTKLVPIVQQAQADYLADPAATNKLIVDAVAKYNDGWTYSAGVADYAVRTMRDLNIVANDASGPLGGMDLNRVEAAVNTFSPILRSTGATIPERLLASDIATTEFIDKNITLPH
ncbi:hypothetical protein AB0D08_21460 [Kitasatospora sp. NPDC048540]|uniref:hypothetical protein n=1 Tax=unclassified Kitasatospora TaxID=2633591 RepID=UPI00053B4F0F|nr:hypothetical protein [Kitasatospora sp. MBT63]